MHRRLVPAVTVGLVAAIGTGCGGATSSDDITVFAAASLSDAFTDIGEVFMAEHPDHPVTFSFAASSELVAQVLDGAPADVVATADLVTIDRLVAADTTASTPVVFARNRAAIVVAADNPLGIAGLADLDDDLVLVVCAPEAPCGRYANELFANAGIAPTPDSFERNPRAVLTKVALGEADAGIVYETDIAAAGEGTVAAVAIPNDSNIIADYPIATITGSAVPDAAQDFIDIVLGPAGQAILTDHGFIAP